ncbi:hypothetical protein C8R44DRAFT_992361 [Mycena epipterygia]|nr:hypothetical protein C8R44DRAFT_992361 [Mycena epipterygia]
MLSASLSMSPSTLNAIWMASPPPPFPTSSFISTAFCFFLRCSSDARRTGLKSPALSEDRRIQSPITPRGATNVTKNQSGVLISPALQLGSDQSLRRSARRDRVKSQSYIRGEQDAGVNDVGDIEYSESKASFRGATGVGLGLGLPTGREFVLSMRSTSSATNVAGKSAETPSTTAAATWGLFDAFSAFMDSAYALSEPCASPILPSSPPPHQSLTGILPHVFAPTALSPMMFWRPNPPTPETTCPRSLRFKGTPVYHVPSPVPAQSNKRARRRPLPRRPRTCTTGVEVKSPIFEYHASEGTTPYDRHGWDQMASFNASRGSKKPFPHPDHLHSSPVSSPVLDDVHAADCPCTECLLEPSPRIGLFRDEVRSAPKLPWMRVPVHTAPYTALPSSPVVPSSISRSPRPENHHGKINRYRSEAVRRRLMKLVFVEPYVGDVVRTPAAAMKRRTRLLVQEEECAVRERKQSRWWS